MRPLHRMEFSARRYPRTFVPLPSWATNQRHRLKTDRAPPNDQPLCGMAHWHPDDQRRRKETANLPLHAQQEGPDALAEIHVRSSIFLAEDQETHP